MIFLFALKMGHKAVETIHNINNVFGPGTANKCTVQCCLEDEERSGWPSKVDNDHLRAIIEANPLKTTQEVAEELNVDHSTVIWYLKQIGKVKKLGKWCSLKSSLILCSNSEPFLHWVVMCNEKWILYNNQQ
ncbi:hypothetical protein FD755_001982 [Muntiacus reevesi]|uniref:Mos1 transposase HTH domain-containing protein n=1 Tax=Muntiacus reevesi TaxID=9886 RepID=A0A5J5N3I5_MUNRE|nr:hypothetical protein FD755_001982 [Muntiacus reevesi]